MSIGQIKVFLLNSSTTVLYKDLIHSIVFFLLRFPFTPDSLFNLDFLSKHLSFDLDS